MAQLKKRLDLAILDKQLAPTRQRAQALIFDLLGDEAAGVYLNEAFIMQPAKSISGFVIYSDSAQKTPKGNKCRQCAMKHCQFRDTAI